jgi:hypothetical protein
LAPDLIIGKILGDVTIIPQLMYKQTQLKAIKLSFSVNNSRLQKYASVFVAVKHFNPNAIFVIEAKSKSEMLHSGKLLLDPQTSG